MRLGLEMCISFEAINIFATNRHMNLFSKGNQPKHAQQMRLGLRSYYSLRADWDAQQQ